MSKPMSFEKWDDRMVLSPWDLLLDASILMTVFYTIIKLGWLQHYLDDFTIVFSKVSPKSWQDSPKKSVKRI